MTERKISNRSFLIAGLTLSLFLAGFVSYYASSHPDGLERVGQDLGFIDSAKDSAASGSPLVGYGVAGVSDARLSGGIAGVVGVLVTGLAAYGLFRYLKRKPD